MNILFLSIGTLNSVDDRGIYTDLLRQFRNDGHKLYIVSPREKRFKKPTEYLKANNVDYLKVKIGNITKTNIIEKGISTILLENLFLKAIKKNFKNVKFDLIIYSTPPVTFEKIIKFIKKRDNAKSYLLLKDIFPQNALDLNMFTKKSIPYLYFRFKEKKLYNKSDFIGCMSQANVDYVLKHNPSIPSERVEICPNSIQPIAPIVDDYSMSLTKEKYSIPPNKIIFIYGGNLGKPQGMDFVMTCLESNRNNSDVYFIIVGSGTQYKEVESFIECKGLKNVQLIPILSKKEYDNLLTICDVGLIFLDCRFTIPNFPSRLLSYMQASIPVLAATDSNTDIGDVIVNGEFGFWCKSNNVSDFNRLISRFCNTEKIKILGLNGRKYLEENYTSKHTYDVIMKHFE